MTWQYNNQLNKDEGYVRRREDRILLWDDSTLYNNKLTRSQDIARIKDDEDTDTVMTWDEVKLTRMLSNIMVL